MNRRITFYSTVIFLLLLTLSLTVYFFQFRRGSAGRPLVVSTKRNGCYDYKSVNGFGLLTDLIRSRGGRVIRKSIVSPSLKNADLIIWAHKGADVPSAESLEKVAEFAGRANAEVWFFHNDWNNEVAFLRNVLESADPASREAARFYLKEAQSKEFEGHSFALDLVRILSEDTDFPMRESTNWFDIKSSLRSKAKVWKLDSDSEEIPGKLTKVGKRDYQKIRFGSESTEAKPAASFTGSYLVPVGEDHPAKDEFYGMSEIRRLGARILLISDPSFVSNYGIVQPENRVVVQSLVDRFPPFKFDVHYLETGPFPVVTSDSDNSRVKHLWKWMGMGNLPLVVINALLVALLFCFSKIPIFGKPALFSFRQRNDMKDHIVEVGKMLEGSPDKEKAEQTIHHYYQMSRSSPIGKQKQ